MHLRQYTISVCIVVCSSSFVHTCVSLHYQVMKLSSAEEMSANCKHRDSPSLKNFLAGGSDLAMPDIGREWKRIYLSKAAF